MENKETFKEITFSSKEEKKKYDEEMRQHSIRFHKTFSDQDFGEGVYFGDGVYLKSNGNIND